MSTSIHVTPTTMTQAPASITSRAYNTQPAPIDVGELLPITVGSITFDLDFLDGVESFGEYRDRILAYGTLLAELNVDPEEVEWNSINGWEYISDDPVVINEFAVLHDGEVVEADDYLEGYFAEAVNDEVLQNPRRYPNVNGFELAQSLLGRYRVSYDEQNGLGYFRRIQEPVADPWQALNDADDVDGTNY